MTNLGSLSQCDGIFNTVRARFLSRGLVQAGIAAACSDEFVTILETRA
jgi:hypothetical protein